MKYQVLVEGRYFDVDVRPDGRVWVNGNLVDVDLANLGRWSPYSLLVDHRSYEAYIAVEGEQEGEFQVVVGGQRYQTRLRAENRLAAGRAGAAAENEDMNVLAPLPGLVVEVRVVEGQPVEEGDVMVILESMKMNLELRAPRSGVVRTLKAAAGREVSLGEKLAVVGEDAPQA